MSILNFLVQLMSGAMLLLFSVRFMRIGIERLWSARIRESLNAQSSTLGNVLKGAGLGFVMQGATVVMLIAAGLAGTGAIPAVSAAVVALGADMGSALAVQFLHLPVSALGPLAILAGATLYLRAASPRYRNFGRTILGLGLIFLSLSIIRASVAPLGTMPGTAAAVGYLNGDPVTAALAGMVLTLIMHSSVAALLTAVAFSSHAGLGTLAGLAFMLGCNLGSALLPLWLLKHENELTKTVATAVAVLRSLMAVLLIVIVAAAGGALENLDVNNTGQVILTGHIAFNFVLLLLAPFVGRLTLYLQRTGNNKTKTPDLAVAIENGSEDDLPLVVLKRRLSGMLDIAAAQLDEAACDDPDKTAAQALESRMNAHLADIRVLYARLPTDAGLDLDMAQQIFDYAIRVERAGDLLSGRYLQLRLEQLQGACRFSDEGQAEIDGLTAAVRRAVLLSQEAVWTGNIAIARKLVMHKQHVADLERQSREAHLARLRRGNLTSLASSNQHLEAIADLKEVNSKLATIGYAVLEQHGQLKKTRLKAVPQTASPRQI
ncbi:Na/Pi symporter [Martelella sp. HB161492]|uniref:Na/Pi cotransporter family protein n=1 Tax=Martelella sp. HB161492 TaxID=2720726 RepID=UPI0015919355|nr:Na/Pi symporter [Martelella sp. HB161492]